MRLLSRIFIVPVLLILASVALSADAPVMSLKEALDLILKPESQVRSIEAKADKSAQKLKVSRTDSALQVASTVCGDNTTRAYSMGLRIMQRYEGVQMQMSKDGECIGYRFFGPGLNVQRAEIVATAYAKSALLWTEGQLLHVKENP